LRKIEKAIEKVFGSDGILPLDTGTVVEVVPNFGRLYIMDPVLLISIFLYQEEDRTPELLRSIVEEFERITGGTITINDQPKELWRTITI